MEHQGVSALAERATEPAPERPIKRRVSSPRAVLAVAVLGTFMAFVDATIVNIAIPDIARDLGATSLSSVSWVLNAYNIVFAAFLVGGGQLADLLGRRRVFILALVTFTAASALCAVAPTLGLLVAARVAQAAGAAMLVPSSLAIVLDANGDDERMHAVAMWAAVAALAAGIGPPLGGLLITASSWRLVFLVNIPVGLVALVLAKRVLVESRAPGRRRVPDLLGGPLLAATIATLVLGIVKGPEWGWASVQVLASFAAAALLGAWFVVRTSRHRTPVVDLALLRVRSFARQQRRDHRDGRRLLRLHALQRPVPDWRVALLDPSCGPRAHARPADGDSRCAFGEPRCRPLRPPAWWSSRARSCGPAGWPSWCRAPACTPTSWARGCRHS